MSESFSKVYQLKNVRRIVRTDAHGESIRYYIGTIDSSIAKDVTFVPVMRTLFGRRSPLNERQGGYQRPGNGARMRTFARYLVDHPLAIVPPVLLSTRGGWTFKEGSGGLGTVTITHPAAIIDGQHRLGGFIHLYESADESREIDFVAYDGLAEDVEAVVFNTINGNAKGVPKGVGAVIEGEWDTQVALQLRETLGSPFYEKIYIAAKTEYSNALFNLSSVKKEIKRTFSHGTFFNLVAEEQLDDLYSIISTYWEIISSAFETEWEDFDRKPKDQEYKLLELTGLIAWSLAAGDILGPLYNPDLREMDWDGVRRRIELIAASDELDLSKQGYFRNATGAVGGPQIHRKIQQILAAHADELILAEDE